MRLNNDGLDVYIVIQQNLSEFDFKFSLCFHKPNAIGLLNKLFTKLCSFMPLKGSPPPLSLLLVLPSPSAQETLTVMFLKNAHAGVPNHAMNVNGKNKELVA